MVKEIIGYYQMVKPKKTNDDQAITFKRIICKRSLLSEKLYGKTVGIKGGITEDLNRGCKKENGTLNR